MTIAAGFLYKTGLLLCADTQFTGNLKLIGSKILPMEYDDESKSVFVTVGHARYARMGVQLIQDSIADIPAAERTLAKMHQIIVAGVRELHQGHLYLHPRRDEFNVQYLIGLWSAEDKRLAFLSTEETAVVRMYGYDCLGSGEVLAHRFIRPRYKRVTSVIEAPKHTEEDVRKLGLEALQEVKQYDPYCGGDTECLTLTNEGKMSKVEELKLALS